MTSRPTVHLEPGILFTDVYSMQVTQAAQAHSARSYLFLFFPPFFFLFLLFMQTFSET